MTNATFPSGAETWGYNALLQLTQRTTISGSATRMNMTYNYTAGADNGQIASSVDAVTGETITYQYDSLMRLVNASSTISGNSHWSDAYTYDGFGNLTGMTPGSGGAPSLSVSVNAATNQIQPTNILYDGNGNVTQFGPSGSLTTLAYDVANRVATVNSTNAYAYDSANQRVYYRNGSAETLYVYGAGGKKLATYTISGITGSQVNFTLESQNVYFAGKLISAEGNAVAVDRLGSVRWSSVGGGTSHTYYPYGVEYNATTNDTEKYATYTRDSLTGLDYAMNRYYASFWGRFTSPDPRWASARATDPGTINRYIYVHDDPSNRSDPSGLCDLDIAGIRMSAASQDGFAVYAENAISVYPYSATAGEFTLGGIIGGALQVAEQKLGPTSQTYAAVAGLLLAYEGGGPINVTTFSGGAQAFTSAVAYLNQAGLTDVTAQINNITYISPGAVGGLYDNGNGIVLLGNNLTDQAATSQVSGWQGPIYATNQFPLCGHDFACMWQQFQTLLGSRSGSACSTAASVGEANNSPLKLFQAPMLNQNDPFFWLDQELLDLGVGYSELPTVSSNQSGSGDSSVTSVITYILP